MQDQGNQPNPPAPQDPNPQSQPPTPPPAQPAAPAEPTPPPAQPAAPAAPTPPPAQPAAPAAAPPQEEEEDKTPANFQLGTMLPPELKVNVPDHQLNFDTEKFLRLLAGSISLSKDEKKRIIESIPKLRQEQIDELIRIFEEEKFKFSQLSIKHVPQLEKLAKQHYQDWMDLEMEQTQSVKKEEDQDKADEIRKSLGL